MTYTIKQIMLNDKLLDVNKLTVEDLIEIINSNNNGNITLTGHADGVVSITKDSELEERKRTFIEFLNSHNLSEEDFDDYEEDEYVEPEVCDDCGYLVDDCICEYDDNGNLIEENLPKQEDAFKQELDGVLLAKLFKLLDDPVKKAQFDQLVTNEKQREELLQMKASFDSLDKAIERLLGSILKKGS